jgi:uncharacterized membrane protein YobD (UPF0266 family)
MKRDDCILEGGKQYNTSSILFFANKFLSFFVSRMNVEESFVKKLQTQSKERLYMLREKKKRERKQQTFTNILPL